MADQRFFDNQGPFRLAHLAEIGGAVLGDPSLGDLEIADVAPLDIAGQTDISFLDNSRYVESFATSGAAACIVSDKHADRAPSGMALLLSAKPYRCYALIASAFYPAEQADGRIDPAAHIDPTASISDGCSVAAGSVIDAGAVLGTGVSIGATAVVGPGVMIDDATVVGAGSSLFCCDIGKRCHIHPGVRIGQRGFGFDMSADGHLDVPQLGRVLVGDDVEIGANSTIDRGAGPDTIIGDGCKIDNLVQIGHNVVLGSHCVVVSQVGIAGSTKLGDFVVLAGQSGVGGHLKIASGTQLAARSGIMRDTGPGDRLVGNPAIQATEFFRQQATLARITRERSKKSDK